MDIAHFGRLLIIVAGILLLVGLLLIALGKLGLGRLPGDIVFQRDGVKMYFPLATSILVSLIVSLILSFVIWLVSRGK